MLNAQKSISLNVPCPVSVIALNALITVIDHRLASHYWYLLKITRLMIVSRMQQAPMSR